MSTKDPNMKVIFGSDTKDFEKGAQAVRQGLKDLDKNSTSMLNNIGSAFGVNTQKVDQMVSSVRGLGYKLVETGSTGAKAFGTLLASITPLGGAIAGLGLSAAIAGFRQLKAEADNFKSTIDGMNMSMATAAYISTYKQVLHDVNSDTGKSVAEAMDKWERGLSGFKARAGAVLTTFMTSSTLGDFIDSTKALRQSFRDAKTAGEEAAKLGSEQADQMKEQLALNYEIKQIDADIAALRREASDKTKSAADREAARVRYAEKVNEKYDKQRDLAQRMLQTQEALDALATNTYDETRRTYEMKAQLLDLDTARENELRSVDRMESSIASSSSAAAAAAKKQREEMQKMAAIREKWSSMGMVNAGMPGYTPQGTVVTPASPIELRPSSIRMDNYWKDIISAEIGEITVSIGFQADTQKIHDITNEVNSLVQNSVTRTAEIIGNLVGTLAGGGDAWGDFKNAALSAFGDMAIAVGKIAVAAGVATLGIKAAFENMNGFAAIAAGAALIALGSAVKASLSSVANGDYSAGGGGYSGSYSSGGSSGNDWDTRSVVVNVNGTLKADGDQLLAVINSQNNKTYYTQ